MKILDLQVTSLMLFFLNARFGFPRKLRSVSCIQGKLFRIRLCSYLFYQFFTLRKEYIYIFVL
jgi:hypothetical protein